MDASEPVVLIVDDEPQVLRFLRTGLASHGYRVLDASTGREAILSAEQHVPDIMLLDLGLPDIDGLDVARRIRTWTQLPIIVLSARGQERVKVEALDAGADDFLTKPFGLPELLARMRVALRHASRGRGGPEEPVFTCGGLRVDLAARRVQLDSTEIKLTPNEFKLLAVLVKHAGKVVTHRQLLLEVWGPHAVDQTQYLRVYMTHLRRKLQRKASENRVFETEAGVGYRLNVDA